MLSVCVESERRGFLLRIVTIHFLGQGLVVGEDAGVCHCDRASEILEGTLGGADLAANSRFLASSQEFGCRMGEIMLGQHVRVDSCLA